MAELIFFSLGLASSLYLNSFLPALLLAGFSFFLVFRKKAARPLRLSLAMLLLFVAGMTAGNLRLPERRGSGLADRVASGGKQEAFWGGKQEAFWIEGRVLSSEPGEAGAKAIVETDSYDDGGERIPDRTMVQLYLPFEPPLPGSRFRASAALSLPRSATNPGQFDHRRYLSQKGILLTGKVKDGSLFRPAGESSFPYFGRCRQMIRMQISDWGGDEGGVILALLLGERGMIDPLSESRMVRSGLFHLVALSGFNIGMILLLISFLFVVLKLGPGAADIFALLFLPLYGLIVGSQPSVWRAILMGMLFLGARLFARPHAAARAILLSFAVLLLMDPREITDAGFQLTYAAALGIVLMYGLCPPLFKTGSAADYLLKLFWVGLSAQLFTLPFLAFHFQRVSPASFLWTPLASLPMFPLFFFGMLYIFGGFLIPGLNMFLLSEVRLFTKLFLLVPEWSSHASLSTLFIPRPSVIYFMAFALALGFFIFGGKRRMAGAVLIIPVMLSAYYFPAIFARKAGDSLIVMDVGQGSSQLLLYDDRIYMVDPADTSYRSVSTARTVIEPLLARLHLDRLDGVFVTHWDRDHAGSLEELSLDIPIGFVAYPAPSAPPDGVANLLGRKKVMLVPLSRGDSFELGRASVKVLHPPSSPEGLSENDLSLVLDISLDGKEILFTGDIEKDGERSILQETGLSKASILLAPHHGAKSSLYQPFSSALSPKKVVFSAGLDNRFRHPNDAVVAHYVSLGSKIKRTDRDGAILFRLDGTPASFAYSASPWEKELWRK